MKLATNKGLTQDPSAPQELSNARKQEIGKDKELNNLIAHHDELHTQLIAIHHQIQKGKPTNLYREFIKTGNRVRAHKKKLLRSAEEAQHKELFGAVRNIIIEQNYQGKPIQFDLDTSHILPKQKMLADLEFKNRDVDKVSNEELLEDHIHSLELHLTLHHLNVPPALQK